MSKGEDNQLYSKKIKISRESAKNFKVLKKNYNIKSKEISKDINLECLFAPLPISTLKDRSTKILNFLPKKVRESNHLLN